MMRHNSQLATATADLIAARWGTEKLPIPREMEAPNLRMIRLPMEGLYSDAYDIMMDLLDTSNIMVGICCRSSRLPALVVFGT